MQCSVAQCSVAQCIAVGGDQFCSQTPVAGSHPLRSFQCQMIGMRIKIVRTFGMRIIFMRILGMVSTKLVIGPLDFVLRALRVLRPCDPCRKNEQFCPFWPISAIFGQFQLCWPILANLNNIWTFFSVTRRSGSDESYLLSHSALASTLLMWPWWVMIPIGDFTDVILITLMTLMNVI